MGLSPLEPFGPLRARMIPTTTMTDCQKGVLLSCCERTYVYLPFIYKNGTIDSLVARAEGLSWNLWKKLPPSSIYLLRP